MLRPSLTHRLLRVLPGIDLRIVADRTLAPERMAVKGELEQPKELPQLPERTGAEPPGVMMESIAERLQRKLSLESHPESER